MFLSMLTGSKQNTKRLKKGAVPSVALGKPTATTAVTARRKERQRQKNENEALEFKIAERMQDADSAIDLQVCFID